MNIGYDMDLHMGISAMSFYGHVWRWKYRQIFYYCIYEKSVVFSYLLF